MGIDIKSTLYMGTTGALKPQNLMNALRNSGYKFSEKDVKMVTKNSDGKLMWLETGNQSRGLVHIKERHGKEFQKLGVETNFPSFIKSIIVNGKIIEKNSNKIGPNSIYRYHNRDFKVAYGKNGFIISVYPIRRKK